MRFREVKPPPEYVELGKMIRAVREKAGKNGTEMSQEDFVVEKKLGVEQRNLSNFERGKLPRSADKVVRLLRAAGVDMIAARRLLLRVWDLEDAGEPRQLTATERRLLAAYDAGDDVIRTALEAIVEKFERDNPPRKRR